MGWNTNKEEEEMTSYYDVEKTSKDCERILS